MKTNVTNLALIALFAAAGPTAALAHVDPPSGDSGSLHWVGHLDEASTAGTPRGAEGPTRASRALENVNIGDGSGPLPQAGARDTPKPRFTREELDAFDAKYPRW